MADYNLKEFFGDRPVILFSDLCKIFVKYPDPEITYFIIMKVNSFQIDVSEISDKMNSL